MTKPRLLLLRRFRNPASSLFLSRSSSTSSGFFMSCLASAVNAPNFPGKSEHVQMLRSNQKVPPSSFPMDPHQLYIVTCSTPRSLRIHLVGVTPSESAPRTRFSLVLARSHDREKTLQHEAQSGRDGNGNTGPRTGNVSSSCSACWEIHR